MAMPTRWQSKVFIRETAELERQMDPSGMRTKCYADGLITPKQKNELALLQGAKHNRDLIAFLEKRPDDEYDVFCTILLAVDPQLHDHSVKRLKKASVPPPESDATSSATGQLEAAPVSASAPSSATGQLEVMSADKEIFLSYGREAEVVQFVNKLKVDLAAGGFSVWLDSDDIPAGCDWHAAIGKGLDQCRALLAVVTPKYVTSQYCISELYTANGGQKAIFPIFYADTDLNSSERALGVKYVISGFNWTMFRPNVDSYEASLEKLKKGLRLGGHGPASLPTTPAQAPPAACAPGSKLPDEVDGALASAGDPLDTDEYIDIRLKLMEQMDMSAVRSRVEAVGLIKRYQFDILLSKNRPQDKMDHNRELFGMMEAGGVKSIRMFSAKVLPHLGQCERYKEALDRLLAKYK